MGLTGLLPLLLFPAKLGGSLTEENLKYLLGFAVGGLLGDVFLHLLPESYQHVGLTGAMTAERFEFQMLESQEENGHSRIGAAVLCGILSFLLLEKVLELSNPESSPEVREAGNRKILGYLNLLANCTDNLLHGLAVGTSFLSSFKLGVTTTAAILLHEIPHEFGDFAILLKSGFGR